MDERQVEQVLERLVTAALSVPPGREQAMWAQIEGERTREQQVWAAFRVALAGLHRQLQGSLQCAYWPATVLSALR